MPAWYCLMVRRGSEASVASRVIHALGLGEADIVLSNVNQWYVLVRMEKTIENLTRVAQISETMFFIGSPDPPEVPEKDVDVVREDHEAEGEDSFLARHFNEWLWHRLREEADRESLLLAAVKRGKGRVEFTGAQALMFMVFGATAWVSRFFEVPHRCAHILHTSSWFLVASVQWSILWMGLLAAAIWFNYTTMPKLPRFVVGWLMIAASLIAWSAQLWSWQNLYYWGCDPIL